MISIIVCHHSTKYLEQLQKNIQETIGVPYEMIVIDNIANKYNIFQAYNQGIAQSNNNILCFAHEDILFHTCDWGKIVIDHFKEPKLGIIGVAGSHYIPKLPGGWWCSEISSGNVIHTIEGKTFLSKWGYAHQKEKSSQAVIVDGLWFCIPRAIIKHVKFDESTFSGFHCYDADICLQIKKLDYDIRIVFDITIEHFSSGSRDILWLKNNLSLYNKWKKELPKGTVKLSKSEIRKAHNATELINQRKKYKLGVYLTIKVWYYYFRWFYPLIIIRRKIVTVHPEIAFNNPLINSFKYILKKKIKGQKS